MRRTSIGLVLLFTLSHPSAFAASPVAAPQENGLCGNAEAWTAGADLSKDARSYFNSFVRGNLSPARGFADGLALLSSGASHSAERMGEYWISLALLKMGNVHKAFTGLSTLASKMPEPETVAIQVGAMDCLNQLMTRYPSMSAQDGVGEKLGKYLDLASKSSRKVIWNYGTRYVLYLASSDEGTGEAPAEKLARAMRIMAEAGSEGAFARGVIAMRSGNSTLAVSELREAQRGALSPDLSDQIHLLLARALYSQKNYAGAIQELKLIDKSSNDLAEALSELSWSTLMSQRYTEAIGAAINLQAGALRRTFQPEALMVTSMALNEMCQYPESLRAIDSFRRMYSGDYAWLDAWNQHPPTNLYPVAVEYLKKKRLPVPTAIVGEWVRSPIFISTQEEMNLISREGPALARTSHDAELEQQDMARKLRESAGRLKGRIAAERGRQKTYSVRLQTLSPQLQASIRDFWKDYTEYRNLRMAAVPWRAIADHHESQALALREKLIDRINANIAQANVRMYRQLQEVAENNRLIEIEIYNGASNDMIWQRAHPDYREMVARMHDGESKTAASKTWNWGKAPVFAEEWSEIWEDELGSFKSDLANNCARKDRYLALKNRRLTASN